MAMRDVTGRDGDARWVDLAADRLGETAPGVEAAARWDRVVRWDLAAQRRYARARDAHFGMGLEQRLRVGWRGLAKTSAVGRVSTIRPRYMTAHAVGEVRDHRELVRDEDDAQPELGDQLAEQVEDLRLDRDVERAHRLVGDDDARLEREGAGDGDALALSAGKRAGPSSRRPSRQADAAEEIADEVRRAVLATEAMDQRVVR